MVFPQSSSNSPAAVAEIVPTDAASPSVDATNPTADVMKSAISTAASKPRLPQLDFLRFVAIILVMGRHAILPPEGAVGIRPLAQCWYDLGWTGVDLFFILSGFLIGGLLFAELRQYGTFDARRFIIRRGFKIWPLYLGYVAIIIALIRHKDHVSLWQAFLRAWPFYTHTQNYTMHSDLYFRYPVTHLWSLAVEEHFYLLLPPLLVFLTRRAPDVKRAIPLFPVAALAVMLGCLAVRALTFHHPITPERNIWPTHLRIDSLAFGVLLAYAWHYKRAWIQPLLNRPGWLLVGGFGVMALIWPYLGLPEFNCITGYTVLYLVYGCILLACMASTLPEQQNGRMAAFFRLAPCRFLAGIGFWSYSIYIVHLWGGQKPSLWFLHQNIPLNRDARWLFVMLLYLATSILLGTLCGRLIEKPTLALRNRLFPA